jgi:hypothetical protein
VRSCATRHLRLVRGETTSSSVHPGEISMFDSPSRDNVKADFGQHASLEETYFSPERGADPGGAPCSARLRR